MFYLIIMLMAGFLGPGSVFLMLVGGLHMVSSIGLWTSFALNAVLILIFFTTSLFCRQELQLLVAKVLSLLYACIMVMILGVLILEAITLRDSCWLTPATTTLIIVASVYLFAGLLHLKQVLDLFLGFVYYLTIPSMYMLLPFYCVFNLTDTTWGTRESVDGGQKSNSSWIQMLLGNTNNETVISGDAETQTQKPETTHGPNTHTPNMADNWIENIKGQVEPKLKEMLFSRSLEQQGQQGEVPKDDKEEEDIWKPICKKLSPLDIQVEEQTNKSRQAEIKSKIKKDLETLKVNALLIYLFVNIVFVLGIFLMQIKFDSLNRFSQDWPLCKLSTPLQALLLQNDTITPAPNSTLREEYGWEEWFVGEPSKETVYMQLDPINTIFIVFFLGVMFFQMVGMIFHRVRNAGHLMATISWSSSSETTENSRIQTESPNNQTIQRNYQLSSSVSYHA